MDSGISSDFYENNFSLRYTKSKSASFKSHSLNIVMLAHPNYISVVQMNYDNNKLCSSIREKKVD